MLRQEYHTVCGTYAASLATNRQPFYAEEMKSMVRSEVNMKYSIFESDMSNKVKSIVEKSLPSAKSSLRDFLNDSVKMRTVENEIIENVSNRLITVTNNVLMQAVADPAYNSVINAHLQHLNNICSQYKDISISNVQKLMDQLYQEKNEAIQSIKMTMNVKSSY